jgi:hypothetical protein
MLKEHSIFAPIAAAIGSHAQRAVSSTHTEESGTLETLGYIILVFSIVPLLYALG